MKIPANLLDLRWAEGLLKNVRSRPFCMLLVMIVLIRCFNSLISVSGHPQLSTVKIPVLFRESFKMGDIIVLFVVVKDLHSFFRLF